MSIFVVLLLTPEFMTENKWWSESLKDIVEALCGPCEPARGDLQHALDVFQLVRDTRGWFDLSEDWAKLIAAELVIASMRGHHDISIILKMIVVTDEVHDHIANSVSITRAFIRFLRSGVAFPASLEHASDIRQALISGGICAIKEQNADPKVSKALARHAVSSFFSDHGCADSGGCSEAFAVYVLYSAALRSTERRTLVPCPRTFMRCLAVGGPFLIAERDMDAIRDLCECHVPVLARILALNRAVLVHAQRGAPGLCTVLCIMAQMSGRREHVVPFFQLVRPELAWACAHGADWSRERLAFACACVKAML